MADFKMGVAELTFPLDIQWQISLHQDKCVGVHLCFALIFVEAGSDHTFLDRS